MYFSQKQENLADDKIKNLSGETRSTVEAWALNQMRQGLSIPDWNQHKLKWEQLKNIPFPKAPERNTIDILIRSDHPELTLALTECYRLNGAPVARKTPMEWTCVGRLPALSSAKRIAYATTLFGSRPCTRPVSMNVGDRLSWSEKSRRQSVESGGYISYVKGRKVTTMDQGPLRSSHSVEGRVPLLT